LEHFCGSLIDKNIRAAGVRAMQNAPIIKRFAQWMFRARHAQCDPPPPDHDDGLLTLARLIDDSLPEDRHPNLTARLQE
jgi:hypothetical protein